MRRRGGVTKHESILVHTANSLRVSTKARASASGTLGVVGVWSCERFRAALISTPIGGGCGASQGSGDDAGEAPRGGKG